jgi:hypothetical protein
MTAYNFLENAQEPESMTDAKLRVLARHSRKRSRQVLAKAETTQNADARRTMRRVAASYRKLARRLEMELGGMDKA